MTIGKRIKRIRQFRGLTQRQLGMLLDFEKNGDVRIAQYESDSRTPKAEIRCKMADALGVSHHVFSPTVGVTLHDLMQTIFWLEELKGGGDIYDCINEWKNMKTKYETGLISAEEYFEWKLTYQSPPSDLSE